jgi:DNA-binding winged helix-turn-helix (wHTH) protein
MEKSSEEFPVVIAHEGPLDGQRWMIRESLIIGRDSVCDISIPNRQVSRQHAKLIVDNDSIFVEDMGSKNGTHHNGFRIQEKIKLDDGDVIQIALAQKLIFLSADATLPLDQTPPTPADSEHQGRLQIDKRSRRVWINNEELAPPLSASQYKLLESLYDHSGRVVSRNDVVTHVWGAEKSIGVSEQALDALVRRLRDRISQLDPDHEYIVTIRGQGFRLDNPEIND